MRYIFIIFITFLFQSCKEKKKDQFYGYWRVEYSEIGQCEQGFWTDYFLLTNSCYFPSTICSTEGLTATENFKLSRAKEKYNETWKVLSLNDSLFMELNAFDSSISGLYFVEIKQTKFEKNPFIVAIELRSDKNTFLLVRD